MRSNRAIQTILQALMLVLLAAIVFRMPSPEERAGPTHANPEAVSLPSNKELIRAFREYFEEHPETQGRAELLSVSVRDISLEGQRALVKLQLDLKWVGENPNLTLNVTEGPLKNAPGNRGDTPRYIEAFRFRRWLRGGQSRWEVEGRREQPSAVPTR